MNSIQRKGTAIALAAALALGLSACGGGSGGNLTNEIRDLKNDLAAERDAHAATQASLNTANGEVTRLTGELGTANGEVTRLTGELGTANGEVTRLTGELGTANGNVTRLEGELGTANGEVARLTGELATATDNIGELQGQLNTANGEVTRLTGELTTANGEVTRLTGQLGTANGEVTRLTGELETANGEVTRLTGELGTANGEVTRLTGELETANETIETLQAQLEAETDIRVLFATAQSSTTGATNAGMAASDAVKAAMDASAKLGVLGSGGDSAMEMANAQAIMDAQADAAQAVMDAQAALDAANTAMTTAEGLDDGAQKDAVIEALNAAIKTAEMQVEAATDARDSTDLSNAVDMVTGGEDADPQGTPASLAKAVADAIHTALTTDAPPDAVTDFKVVQAIIDDTDATTGEVMMGDSDAQGMTWAQIAGSGLVNMRIAAGASAASRAVMAKSVDGMTAGDLGLTAAPGTADGTEVDTAVVYKGIGGVLFCAGSDCKVENVVADTFAAATSKLTGSWYFAPDEGSMATYIAGATAGTYTLEDPATYVRYGYWLSVDSATDETINRYISGPAAQKANVYGVDSIVPAFADNRATYTGDAIGMSVVWETDTKGAELAGSRASGEFMADVNLTMSFGATARLEGTISNFRGTGVDTSWSVDLDRTDLTGGTLTGVTDGGDVDGAWTATVWGGAASEPTATPNPAARPTGVYGAFDADFTNGAAAGVYATRKQ